MTTVLEELLGNLQKLDVKLHREGDRLRASAPPGALTPDLQAEIKRWKPEILRYLEAAQPGRRTAPALQPTPRTDPLPLSFGQQRLWFLHQLEPDSAAYNIPAVIRQNGPLNPGVLDQCLTEMVRRHEVLRTTFALAEGQPVQVIAPAAPVQVPFQDCSGLAEAERDATVTRLIEAEARQPFDLEKGPLWRARLIRVGPEQHVFLFTMHHIVCDRWSLGLFFRELETLEGAFRQGRPSPLPELPIQYADFAQWQRNWFTGEVLAGQLGYWREQLSGALPVLELPTDRPRPALQTYRSASRPVVIPPALTQALNALSQREGCTLYMTLLAAFKVLLFRYTGQEDLIVGTPIANRNLVETERLIGFFINTLVLRTRFSGELTFREFLARVREVAVGAYGHQDLPFEKLVEELQPERDLSRSPLFQVMFVLQNVPKKLDVAQIGNLSFSSSGASTYDLSLDLGHGEQGIMGFLDFNLDLFDEATITRLLEHFFTLLEGIVADPDRRLCDLPLLTEPERRQLLEEFNPGPAAAPAQSCVHRLIEAQADRAPDQVAVVLEDEQLTYGRLNARANQLARHLQNLGVKEDAPVAVYLDRSVDMILALLAVLKAGGAYVPVDPATPPQRLSALLEDARPAVILTRQTLASVLPAGPARVVSLDADGPAIAREAAENLALTPRPESLAYVIFTSGSTGRPKGVMVSHQAILNHITAASDYWQLTPRDGVLQFSSLSFDASLEQIFCALASGSRLVLRGADVWPTSEFLERVRRFGVTVADLPTAYWQQWVRELAEEAPDPAGTPLRLLMVGGEAMTPEALQLWQRCPWRSIRLLNAYGPTEATVTATVADLSAGANDGEKPWRVPIGRPIGAKKVHILDRWGGCVPVGVAGELHIGGPALACGYLNQPELTASRFVADPFSAEPAARLYKTGDLARYRPDGSIEFLGRVDDQVKIRGYRIEPAEVEAVLGRHPAVRECVVLARADESGEKRLFAYAVPRPSPVPTVTELREFLRQELPEYMLPAAIVLLEAFPLTAGGKVDRAALPLPAAGERESGSTFVAPRDPLELQLAKLWEQVLGRQPIGVTDNFFEVGGHSLLAVKLFSRIEKTLGRHLPLATLYQDPTIERQANIFRQEGWKAPWSSLVPIQPGGSKPPLFLVHGVGGNVLFCRGLAKYLGDDQPFYAIQSQGLDVNKEPHNRIEAMAEHYLKELRNLQPSGPYFLGGFCMGGMVAFEMARQLQLEGQRTGLVALLETHGPGYFLSPRNNVQFFYEERTLAERIRENLRRFKAASPEERRVLLSRKAGLVRNKIEVRITGILSNLLRRLGHRTLAALQRTHHNNVQAQMVYAPRSLYPGRVHLFRATKQPLGNYKFDPLYGWGPWATGGVEVLEFPGYHGTFMEEPYVSVFAERLKECLREAQASLKVNP